MSTDKELGALGKRFNDLPSPADNPDLSWEKIAPQVLQSERLEEDSEDGRFIWWWFTVGGLVLLILAGWFALSPKTVATTNPIAEKIVESQAPTEQQPDNSYTTTPVVVPQRAAANSEPTNTFAAPTLFPKLTSSIVAQAEVALTYSDQKTSRLQQRALPASQREEEQLTAPISVAVPQLPTELIATVSVPNRDLAPAVIEPLTQPAAGADQTKALTLLTGPVSYNLGYSTSNATETDQLSALLRLGYEQSLNDRWFISTGLELRHYRFQSAFEDVDEDARIYQPGTVDTIFRNLTTGEETVSTTDTVSGTRVRRF